GGPRSTRARELDNGPSRLAGRWRAEAGARQTLAQGGLQLLGVIARILPLPVKGGGPVRIAEDPAVRLDALKADREVLVLPRVGVAVVRIQEAGGAGVLLVIPDGVLVQGDFVRVRGRRRLRDEQVGQVAEAEPGEVAGRGV